METLLAKKETRSGKYCQINNWHCKLPYNLYKPNVMIQYDRYFGWKGQRCKSLGTPQPVVVEYESGQKTSSYALECSTLVTTASIPMARTEQNRVILDRHTGYLQSFL